MADVMGWENQQAYFNLQNLEAKNYQQRVAEHWFQMTGNANAGIRAQNAASSIYNPVGLATQLGMMTYGQEGSRRAMAQGFMAMNIYAPGPFDDPNGFRFGKQRDTLEMFQEQMDMDFFADPGGYGGFNLQGRSEVFSQMSQRSMFGKNDIGQRASSVSSQVKKMSQAVGAMQELFGGTIPELFDKMDAIFGGNAAAMGGDQLMSRVMKMKQTSQLTGQSLNSLAQMNMMGGQYAEMAGMDAGIGANAAEQTAIALGVNYAGGLTSTRRINQGRLRSASLRANTSATASRMSQYYAGAYMTFLEGQGLDYNTMTAADRAKYSGKFAGLASGASSIGELATAAGSDVMSVRYASMSNAALEAMADDENIANFGIQGNISNAQGAIARAMRRAVTSSGTKVDMSVFMNKGQLRSTKDIISDLTSKYGMSRTQAQGIIDNQMEQAGGALYNMNGQELEAYFFQQRNAGGLRELRDNRAEFDKKMGGGVGGLLGIMNFLGTEGAGSANLGQVLGSALGILTPEDQRKKMSAGDFTKQGTQLANKMKAAFEAAKKRGDHRQAGMIATAMNKISSAGSLTSLSTDQLKNLRRYVADIRENESGDISEPVELVWDMMAGDQERLADKALTDSGLTKEYGDAMQKADLTDARQIGRTAAARSALKGIKSKQARERMRNALFGDEKKKDDDFTSIRDAKKRLKDLGVSDEERRQFISDLEKKADALKTGDPKQGLESILSRLADVLETLATDRPATKKGPE
jgi:hypothetical protein